MALHPGNSFSKNCRGLFGGIERGKAFAAFEWQEQDARKRAVNIGQRDQHIRAARPDVQRVGLEQMLAAGPGGNGQFFVAVVEIFLRED